MTDADKQETIWSLCKLLAYEPDWNGYGSPEISAFAVGAACKCAMTIDMPKPFVCPTNNGGVQMEWDTAAGRHLEIEISNTGPVVWLAGCSSDGSTTVGEFAVDDGGALVKLLAGIASE